MRTVLPDATAHIRMVESPDALASILESGDHATQFTLPEWPIRVRMFSPVRPSKTSMLPSSHPHAKRELGAQARVLAQLSSFRTRCFRPVLISQIATESSFPPDASRRLSDDHAAAYTVSE